MTARAQRILPRLSVPTRDGVSLCTDVYLPGRDGPRPAVVFRTPYGRNAPFQMLSATRLNALGFAAVLQDCRGRYQSGGEFRVQSEVGDARDTLAWLAAQEWCDGRVGLVGFSFTSFQALRVAVEAPPSGIRITAVVNVMGIVDYHSVFYRDGAMVLHWALPWIVMMSAKHQGRSAWLELPWRQLYSTVPLAEAPRRAAGEVNGLWHTITSSPEYGEHWEDLDVRRYLPQLEVPTLHISGWYDFLLGHVLRAYTLSCQGGAEQKLVVGPWDHRTIFGTFAAKHDSGEMGVLDLLLGWFRRWMGEEGAAGTGPLEGDARAIFFVSGKNQWVQARSFPPTAAVERDLYLSSGGGANSAAGDGVLSPAPSTSLGYDWFAFDPADPVPTTGGAIWPFQAVGLTPGFLDQSAVESRPDVLVYTTPPLPEDWSVIGPVEVELWASSSAPDTDFTAKLVDVDRRGIPRILQDGIRRSRSSRSLDRAQPLPAQKPQTFRIDLEAVAHCFARGHRIRLEIASSNFPKYDRNWNGSVDPVFAQAGVVAQQTVFHGGAMPSRLRLRVVPAEYLDAARLQARAEDQGERSAGVPAPQEA